jgi:hypothetical protein
MPYHGRYLDGVYIAGPYFGFPGGRGGPVTPPPTEEVVTIPPGRQANAAVLAGIQPDAWGMHGPNQTVEIHERLTERNNRVYRGKAFCGVSPATGSVRVAN